MLKLRIRSKLETILNKVRFNKISILYYEKNTPNTVSESRTIEPASFTTIPEHRIAERDQDIEMQTVFNQVTIEKIKALASEKELAL